jgi:hypothetical protein
MLESWHEQDLVTETQWIMEKPEEPHVVNQIDS